MRKTFSIIAFVILGSLIGYFIGIASKCPLYVLLLVMLNGGSFGYFLGMAVFWKRYGAILWSIVATLIALAVDWAAGSTRVSILDKLAFALAGIFIGFNFSYFWKQVLIVGLIGGFFGFVWGMNDSLWFGYAHLGPGLITAMLSSVKFSIYGMLLGSLYMELFGWRRLTVATKS